MTVSQQKQRGKRVKSYPQNRRVYRNYSRAQKDTRDRRERSGEPEQAAAPAAGHNWRLTVSAMILIGVIAVKLIVPQALENVRGRLLHWMGTDTDFVSVFSAVGKAVGSENGWGDAMKDAYTAVFDTENTGDAGSETMEDLVYSDDNLPDQVCLQQKILGFPHQKPLEAEISDGFGYRQHPIEADQRFHYGIDLQADEGTVIAAFADGQVTAVGESSVLGKYVTVQHSGGFQSLYAHCSRVMASTGQQVRLGDPIAEVGQTGQTTGAHLHFELLQDNVYLNPVYYVAE